MNKKSDEELHFNCLMQIKRDVQELAGIVQNPVNKETITPENVDDFLFKSDVLQMYLKDVCLGIKDLLEERLK
jgi:hypothetical protein